MFKKNIFCFSILFVFCLFCFRCNSTRNIEFSDTQSVGRLEATISGLDDLIRDSEERLEAVREQSERITDGIENLEYLFNEYEREVGRILEEIIRIRDEAKNKVENNSNSSDNCYTNNSN